MDRLKFQPTRWISKPAKQIIILWLSWAVILILFQNLVDTRYQPVRPDTLLDWTADYTGADSQQEIPYLGHDFLNTQVSWDSQYYLSIAQKGYDDPQLASVTSDDGERVELSHAFFPFYPYLIRITAAPLRLIGINSLSAYTLTGVAISVLGALAAMLALYDITRATIDTRLRVVFYFLIFPTGFFLAQVYAEGLFVGLAFSSLALMRRKQLAAAVVLTTLAVWTRSIGVALVIPLGLNWLDQAGVNWKTNRLPLDAVKQISRADWLRGLALAALPVGAFVIWWFVLGPEFRTAHDKFFGRSTLAIYESMRGWGGAALKAAGLTGDLSTAARLYLFIEVSIVALACLAPFLTLRQYPDIALFSLAVMFIFITSDVTTSGSRVAMTAPSLFILLGDWGKHWLFDRTWTLISLLLMGMSVSLFTFNMWVA